MNEEYSTQGKPYEVREARMSMYALGESMQLSNWTLGEKKVGRDETAKVGVRKT